MSSTPIRHILVYDSAAMDRTGKHRHAPTPAMLDWLEDLEATGGIAALCKKVNGRG